MILALHRMPQTTDPIDSLVANLETQTQRVVRSRSVDAVHDLRVTIRRLLQGIELYRSAKKSRKPLRHLLSLAGAVRDCDIALKLLSKPWAKPSEGLRQRITERRRSARRMLVAELKSWSGAAVEWRARVGSQLPAQSLAESQERLPKMAEEFLERGHEVASKDSSPAELHKFRIQAKELRYSIELMKPAIGPAGAAWIEPVQGVQTALGEVNDCRIVRDLARELGGGKGVDAGLRKRLKKKIRKFLKLWHQRFSRGAAEEWVKALEPPARKPMAQSRTGAYGARLSARDIRAAKRA